MISKISYQIYYTTGDRQLFLVYFIIVARREQRNIIQQQIITSSITTRKDNHCNVACCTKSMIGRPPVIPTNISQRTDPAIALPLLITPSPTQPTISQQSPLQHPAQPLSQPVAHYNLRFQQSRELALTCSLLSFPLQFYSSN